MTNSAQLWTWLAVAMIPATLAAGWRLWVVEKRGRIQRLRLEAFRGPIRANAQVGASKWEQFGRRFAPLVGGDQQRIFLGQLENQARIVKPGDRVAAADVEQTRLIALYQVDGPGRQ